MAFPETMTLDPALSRGTVTTGAFYHATSGKWFNVLRDGTNLVMYSSSDGGVTWAQAGGLGPAYEVVVAGGSVYMAVYGNVIWVVYIAVGVPQLSFASFDITGDDWTGTVIDTGYDAAPMQLAMVLVSGAKLVVFGAPTSTSIDEKAVYSIFDLALETATDWADVGMAGLVGSYPASYPIGICAGTSGRVHLIGATVDPIVAPDHLWQQTLYPETNTLGAVDEFSSDSENNSWDLFPVCALSGGRVCVRLSIGSGTGPYTYLVGTSADVIVFAPIAGPALPVVGSQAIGIISNGAGARVFVMDRVTDPAVPEYFSCTFDGTTFGPFSSIGSSATLFLFPFPALQATSSPTQGFYAMTWAGSVFFWMFFAPVVIAPVVGVLAGGAASTPIDLSGSFIGVKRRREC